MRAHLLPRSYQSVRNDSNLPFINYGGPPREFNDEITDLLNEKSQNSLLKKYSLNKFAQQSIPKKDVFSSSAKILIQKA